MDRSPITLLTDLITKEAELGGFDPYTYTYLLGKRCGAVLLSQLGWAGLSFTSSVSINMLDLPARKSPDF